MELSHTHVRLRGDDGQIYDIAIDDVFADGYEQAGESVPAPLSQIQPGDHLELCGKPYTSGRVARCERGLAAGDHRLTPAQPGDDLVLTIDQALQFETERALADQVQRR